MLCRFCNFCTTYLPTPRAAMITQVRGSHKNFLHFLSFMLKEYIFLKYVNKERHENSNLIFQISTRKWLFQTICSYLQTSVRNHCLPNFYFTKFADSYFATTSQCAFSPNLFHGQIAQIYIDQLSDPENKKCSP